MSRNIWDVLMTVNHEGAAADAQLKLAAEKLGHQPEMGPTSGNRKQTEGLIDEQVGGTSMDAKAILHTRAMEQAGYELEGRTWDDPREAANARNLAVSAGGTPKAPVDPNRHNSQPANKNLPRPVHVTKAAGVKDMIGRAKNLAKTKGGDIARKVKSKATQGGMLLREHAGKAAIGAAGVGAVGGYAAGSKKEASYSLADHWATISEGPEAVKLASEKVAPAEYAAIRKVASQAYLMGARWGLGQIKEAAGVPFDPTPESTVAEKRASFGAVGVLDETEVAKAIAAAHQAKVAAMSDEEAAEYLAKLDGQPSGYDVPIKTAADADAYGRLSFHGMTDVIKLAGELIAEHELPVVIEEIEARIQKLADDVNEQETAEEADLAAGIEEMASEDPDTLAAVLAEWRERKAGGAAAEGDQE